MLIVAGGVSIQLHNDSENIMSKVMNKPQHQAKHRSLYRNPKYRGAAIPVTQTGDVKLGLIIGNAQHIFTQQNIKRFNLCILDLDDAELPLTSIPMPFFGHGVVPDPVNPQLVSVFEKRGKGACEIDLKQGKVVRTIETGSNREFYGHGAYSPDGNRLYCTETIVEGDYPGLVAVRDAKTHEYLGEFPSFGSSPHDCHLIENGKTMVVTNGGGPLNGSVPNVSYIDVESEALIESVQFDASHINAGHLDITSNGKLAVVSAQRTGLPQKSLGGISIRQGDILHTLTDPEKLIERLFDESLSVCIHEENSIVGATTPEGNLLTFWNIDDGRLLHYYNMQTPRGIELSLDGQYFIVSFGQGDPAEAIALFSADTLEQISGMDMSNTGITGSHLTAYAFPPHMRR